MTSTREQAQADIERLLSSYPLLLDSGDVDGCIGLFADDGQFVLRGNTIEGHDAIRAVFEAASANGRVGIHLPGPTLIDVGDDGVKATAWQSFFFVANGENNITRGMYRDQVRLDRDRWRFQRREVVLYPGPE
jgi:uncharacterized protein (TIGR02246 family)